MKVFKVLQSPKGPKLDDIPSAVCEQFAASGMHKDLQGKRVAVAVGSRGIASLPVVVKALVECLRSSGAIPFIVPAMGSHGGGTAPGQTALLASLGITTEIAPIMASMDVAELETTATGVNVCIDKNAWEADHVILVNRIKAHPTFDGPFESGLFKMLGIGLGKLVGAKRYHRAIAASGFTDVIGRVARTVIGSGKILGAIAILENSNSEIAQIEAVRAEDIEERERGLLRVSKSWMLGLPFDEIDLLVVDEIGKEISGTGMDLGIVGRKTSYPLVHRIYVRGLSEGTMGNASGIGVADFCHLKLLYQIDFKKTYTNCLASGFPEKAKIPVYVGSDKEMLDIAKSMMGKDELKIVWIKNTLKLDEMWASEALWSEGCETLMDLDMMQEDISIFLPK